MVARKVDPGRREAIALAAFDAMRERGFQRTTMSEIASALGMKRPTLYFYYRDLAQLFEAMFEITLRREATVLLPALAAESHPVDRLFAYVAGTHAFYESRSDLLIMLFQFWAAGGQNAPGRVFEIADTYLRPVRSGLIEALAAGIGDGVVSACDPAATVDFVLAMTDGTLVHHLSRGLALAPIRELLWRQVLAPLKQEANP